MKFTKLITALVFGASTISSVAVAQPSWGQNYDPSNSNPSYSYDYDASYGWVPPNFPGYGQYGYRHGFRHHRFQQHEWMPLQGSFQDVGQQQEIGLGPQFGAFRTLRLDATDGAIFVSQVMVQFANFEKQIVTVNRWINPARPLVLDLAGGRRSILRVMVYTPRGRTANYQLAGL
jgi:hypothetical protein